MPPGVSLRFAEWSPPASAGGDIRASHRARALSRLGHTALYGLDPDLQSNLAALGPRLSYRQTPPSFHRRRDGHDRVRPQLVLPSLVALAGAAATVTDRDAITCRLSRRHGSGPCTGGWVDAVTGHDIRLDDEASVTAANTRRRSRSKLPGWTALANKSKSRPMVQTLQRPFTALTAQPAMNCENRSRMAAR